MEQKRGALARIGVTLLNLFAPGLGLLRLGKWKFAAAVYLAALSLLIFVYAPPVGFWVFVGALVIGLAIYPVSIVSTWLFSRTFDLPRPWYARWYAILAAALLAVVPFYFLGDEQHVRYRSFYTPAEGMAPTFPTGDRFFAYMSRPSTMHRGDLLLVRAPDGSTYVKRLVALPGDVIDVADGTVILNGKPVAQQLVRSETITDAAGTRQIQRKREQFPGEIGPHEIYDDGDSIGDNFGPQQVRPGHIFLMGDNRDHSADSRFSVQEMGLEQLPVTDILGWPMYHSFGSSRPIGEAINRRDMK